MTLDLPSAITGGAVALVLGLVAGFAPQVTQVPSATLAAPRQITGHSSAHPRDFIWLHAEPSQPSALLTVPAGKILVLTGLSSDQVTNGGQNNTLHGVNLEIDGVAFPFELLAVRFDPISVYATQQTVEFHNGIPLIEGQTVRLTDVTGLFVWLHGYWADA